MGRQSKHKFTQCDLRQKTVDTVIVTWNSVGIAKKVNIFYYLGNTQFCPRKWILCWSNTAQRTFSKVLSRYLQKGYLSGRWESHLVHMPVLLEQAPDMLGESQRGLETVPDYPDAVLVFSRTTVVITILCYVHSLTCDFRPLATRLHAREPYQTENHERSVFVYERKCRQQNHSHTEHVFTPRFYEDERAPIASPLKRVKKQEHRNGDNRHRREKQRPIHAKWTNEALIDEMSPDTP